jgi:hypothetical protein
MPDGEPFKKVHYIKIIKARKTHECNDCGRDISPKEKYEAVSVIDDMSNRVIFKTCSDCLSVWGAFFCDRIYGGILWEEIPFYLEESGEECITKALLKCTKPARDKILKILQEQNTPGGLKHGNTN